MSRPAAVLAGLALLAAGHVAGIAAPRGGTPGGPVPAGRAGIVQAAAGRRVPPAAARLVSDTAGTPIAFGAARDAGGAPSSTADPVVGIAGDPGAAGYWIAAANGAVFTFGGARYHGSMGAVRLVQPVVAIAAGPAGGGYWLVARDGGIFAFGTARFHGSAGAVRLRAPIVGMAATPDGGGYWLVASDGGIFAYGDARYLGSMGGRHVDAPIVGMAATPDGRGYWLVASDGGVFTFGDARYDGSAAGDHPDGPVVGIATGNAGRGYLLASADGGVYAFGGAGYAGSAAGDHPLKNPVVAIAGARAGGYWLLPTTPPPPPPPPALPPGFVEDRVTVIGDSVTIDAEPDILADIPHSTVDAVVGMYWDQGVGIAEQLRAEDALGATVVIALGTNGPVDDAQFQAMMAVLAGATRVVFVTVHLPPSYSWWQSVNETLEAEVPHYADARIADFDALADANPQWFGPDGVHMAIGGPGAAAWAQLVLATIREP